MKNTEFQTAKPKKGSWAKYSSSIKSFFLNFLKGTVDVMSSDLLFVDWNIRFTTIPFKTFTDKRCLSYPFLSSETNVVD